MELLFARLPPPLRASAIRRVAKFLLESTLTSVGAEASVLCNAIAWADPQVWFVVPVAAPGAVCMRSSAPTSPVCPKKSSQLPAPGWHPAARRAHCRCDAPQTAVCLLSRPPPRSFWRRWWSSCTATWGPPPRPAAHGCPR